MRRASTRVPGAAWPAFLLLGSVIGLGGCQQQQAPSRPPGAVPLVLLHQPLLGDPAAFHALLDGFRRGHPEVRLETQLMPNAAEASHQFLLTALEGGSREFDVFVADVIWIPEMARAGWLADLSAGFPPATIARDFLPGPASAVVVEGRTFAVPWFVDVGLLFFRTDLVPRAPRTYAELAAQAQAAMERDPSLRGFVWQGRQYEGLVCNAYESIWGHGGASFPEGGLLLDTDAARAGVRWLRETITSGLSPDSVTSMAEEESRRVFQDGRAVFMRNWPYAWAETQKPGSPVRGRVGYAPLPTVSGEPGFGALGGWQLALNRRSPSWKREAALALIAHLTSPAANAVLAVSYARLPPRPSAYDDPRIVEGAPFIASLLPMVERARPRPVTPYYLLLSDTLQSELSAAITGVRPVDEALARANKQADHVMGATP